LTRRWAIKFPRPTEWRLFLHGLLGNMQERQFSRIGWEELCPVLFSIPGGWMVVMPRAIPLTDEEWEALDTYAFIDKRDGRVPVEEKQSSFGWLNGRIVAIDYGS
jgi:hypothetical protein